MCCWPMTRDAASLYTLILHNLCNGWTPRLEQSGLGDMPRPAILDLVQHSALHTPPGIEGGVL
jgi:hypothetical protein